MPDDINLINFDLRTLDNLPQDFKFRFAELADLYEEGSATCSEVNELAAIKRFAEAQQTFQNQDPVVPGDKTPEVEHYCELAREYIKEENHLIDLLSNIILDKYSE